MVSFCLSVVAAASGTFPEDSVFSIIGSLYISCQGVCKEGTPAKGIFPILSYHRSKKVFFPFPVTQVGFALQIVEIILIHRTMMQRGIQIATAAESKALAYAVKISAGFFPVSGFRNPLRGASEASFLRSLPGRTRSLFLIYCPFFPRLFPIRAPCVEGRVPEENREETGCGVKTGLKSMSIGCKL